MTASTKSKSDVSCTLRDKTDINFPMGTVIIYHDFLRGHELKLGPVGGGGGGGSKYFCVLCWGGGGAHRIKCQIFFWGTRGYILHFCIMSLASGGGGGAAAPRPPILYMCYHFIFSLFYVL